MKVLTDQIFSINQILSLTELQLNCHYPLATEPCIVMRYVDITFTRIRPFHHGLGRIEDIFARRIPGLASVKVEDRQRHN